MWAADDKRMQDLHEIEVNALQELSEKIIKKVEEAGWRKKKLIMLRMLSHPL